MDTIKNKQLKAENKKGGRNEFSKLLIAGGGLVIGSIGGVVTGGNILRPDYFGSPEGKETDKPAESGEDKIIDNKVDKEETQNAESEKIEPTPIDSGNNAGTSQSQNNGGSNSNEDSIDEIAQRIAGSSEIDNGDSTSSLMQIGGPSTMYDMNGNAVNVFAVTFNDPNLEGQQFVLADTDGDGVYDGLYTAEGEPFSLALLNEDGTEHPFEDLLAMANLGYADLEEMQHDDGSFMERNDFDNLSQDESLMADIIGNDEELDQQALLAQLLSEAEDGGNDMALLDGTRDMEEDDFSQEEDEADTPEYDGDES